MRKFEVLLIVFLVTLFAGLTFVAVSWRNRPIYSNAYQGKVEAAREYQRSHPEGQFGRQAAQEDDKIRPYGLREQEIRKREGNRFRTY